MNFWLIKSEPSTYSWSQLKKDKKTCWDGVRNYAARNNLKAMSKGDLLLFYHSNEGLDIVGIAEVAKTSYQDPGTPDPAWVAIDIKPKYNLTKPVRLTEIKKDKALESMQLIKISRLSVSMVTKPEFDRILELSETTLNL